MNCTALVENPLNMRAITQWRLCCLWLQTSVNCSAMPAPECWDYRHVSPHHLPADSKAPTGDTGWRENGLASPVLLMPIHLGKGNSFTAQRNVCHTFFNTAGASLTTPMPRPPNTSTQYHWHKVPTSDCEFLFCKVPPLNRKVLTTPVSSLHSPHAWDNRWLEVIFQLLFTWVIARYSYECFRCSAEMAGWLWSFTWTLTNTRLKHV
jgi:hypothetical protein